MKKLIYTIGLIFCVSSFSIAQETVGDNNIKKTKEFKLLGSEWKYEKYHDASWSLTTKGTNTDIEISDHKNRRHRSSLHFDLGINSWVNDNSAPTVKAWGSWNVAINYQHQYKISDHFSLIPSLGVSWYNFKLEDKDLIALKTSEGIVFEEYEDGEGTKSKIAASFLNLSFIPTFHSANQRFGIGLGPYMGYRVGGRGKFVYDDEDGKSHKIIENSNMYVNNIRYGGRLTVTVSNVDFYVNYDLNELFQQDKGPEVNALSFGLIL
ncbi:outer membrane beta-barrel protein [Echinicola sp. 20G]|uniref:outer membrane beta-barrel protein n=1 Tax=Echinicola sp. 20G TaxID=2781961 RepID=UPI0019105D0E|nr:outer membrane beta-barrel protein [Echinicola sp. 20G]